MATRLTIKALRECFEELDFQTARGLVYTLKDAEGGSFGRVTRAALAVEQALNQANEFAYFGVEPLSLADDSYETVAFYLNTGDQYACTLCYDWRKGKFYLMDWESFVQMLERRYGEVRQG